MSDSAAPQPTELDFDAVYRGQGPFRAPWDIGAPQPAYVAVEQAGGITGAVLDAGCGTGENALYLADRGHSVTGLDLSPTAIELARGKAAERGLVASFDVADALDLDAYTGRFDTVIDSGLAHLLDGDTLRRYASAPRLPSERRRARARDQRPGSGGSGRAVQRAIGRTVGKR